MAPISIDFCDFWPGFPKAKNFFTEVLRLRYDVQLAERPDLLIYGDYGYHHRLYTCPRVFYTGEAGMPEWRECDYALTFHYLDDPRHLRLPLYVLYAAASDLIHCAIQFPGPFPEPMESPPEVRARKTKFCAFVVGNIGRKSTRKRVEFFHRLSGYKPVDSGGRALNNIGGPIPNGPMAKQEFLRPYKFNLCFENRSLPGYTTEKIFEAMRARCIPIYWGSPRVHEEFNPKSFLNYFDFPNEEALVERIIQIDRDDGLYLEYLRQPYFHNNQPNEFFSPTRLLDFFEQVRTAKIRTVGSRRKFFQIGRWILVKKNKPSA
jgi:hypothetical protein